MPRTRRPPGLRRVRPRATRARRCSRASGSARRESRATRGSSRRSSLVPAVLGLALLVLPLVALVAARRVVDALGRHHRARGAGGARALARRPGSSPRRSACVLGVPLALVIARSGPRDGGGAAGAGDGAARAAARWSAASRCCSCSAARGWFGGVLAEWGIRLPFTTTAVVLAQTFVALPFLVLALEGSLRTTGRRLRADRRRARRRPLDDPRAA